MQFEDCCRCCLEIKDSQQQIPLSAAFQDITILELIEEVTNSKILTDENLPDHICKACLQKFVEAKRIKSKFLESQKILKALIDSKKVKDEFQEEYLENDPENEIQELENEELITEEYLEDVAFLDKKEEAEETLKTEEITETKKIPGNYYKCELCFLDFASVWQFERHCAIHRKNNDPPPHSCPNCPNKKFYDTHSFTRHRCSTKRICYYCDQEFLERKQLFEHLNETHRTDSVFQCNVEGCGYTCNSVLTIYYHLSAHFEPQDLICQHCSATFTNPHLFWKHCRRHTQVPKPEVEYTCDLDGIVIKDKRNLARHMQRCHLNRRYQCEFCPEKSYRNQHVLRDHKVKKHGFDSPFQCSQCLKKFGSLSQLNAHEKSHFNVPKKKRRTPEERANLNLTCQHCLKCFHNPYNLRKHIEIIHLKIKEFACPWEGCTSSFGRKFEMTTHYRQHSGEKPLNCSECEFKCADPSTLYKHLKNVHKIVKKKEERSRKATK